MITLQNLTLDFDGKRVLDDFSLSLPMRGITCLHGPSGCGKTTLLRLIAGLTRPSSCTVTGLPVKTALLFQEDRLLPHLTAEENIVAVLPKETHHQAKKWLMQVDLAEDAHLRPGALSGGMCRRIALARALAYGGDFLLLDEPFTGLDTALTQKMAALIRRTGTPALVVTHSKEEIALLGGRMLEVTGPPLAAR